LEQETFIQKVKDFERVSMENNVKIDHIKVTVETIETADMLVLKNMELFTFKFFAKGFHLKLAQRYLCQIQSSSDLHHSVYSW
jgi:hypothetical protein